MQIILDRTSTTVSPNKYIVVETEVDFLRYADSAKPLIVRGTKLCDWAEKFYGARLLPYEEGHSPIRELTVVCPPLSHEQAIAIHTLLGEKYDQIPRPITIWKVLQACYPQRMWIEPASLAHAATWLTWLVTQSIPAALVPMLVIATSEWQEQAPATAMLYTAVDGERAMQILLAWLGVCGVNEDEPLGAFPGEIPQVLEDKTKVIWKNELVSTHGQTIKGILARQTPQKLKILATKLATDYFVKHPNDLTFELYEAMTIYLDRNQQQKLSHFIAPPLPTAMPTEPLAVQEWYRTSYLPYRLWQSQYGEEKACQTSQVMAQQFAIWYLEQYAKALVGGALASLLSFNRSLQLTKQQDAYITLLIVLDGLHVSDGQYVLQAVQKATARLTPVQDGLVFAPLPTITEFCKDALFKGTPPVHAPHYQPLGEILPENRSPLQALQQGKPGQLYLWRVQEPDATYHARNHSQTLQRDIESQLDGIANKITDLVNDLSPEVALRIVITTDHGRLLTKSTRLLPVPAGMEPHGRAAWGKSEKAFPVSGYLIEDEVVYLHPERFALPVDAAIALTEKAFYTKDGKGGTERYAHGGLYPEEVIVPWMVFLRDLQAPEIVASLSGKGRARTPGKLQLKIKNLSEIQIKVASVTLHTANGKATKIPTQAECPPIYESLLTLEMATWPTPQEAKKITCQIELQLPGKRERTIAADVSIESEEMYTKNQNILEGLDL